MATTYPIANKQGNTAPLRTNGYSTPLIRPYEASVMANKRIDSTAGISNLDPKAIFDSIPFDRYLVNNRERKSDFIKAMDKFFNSFLLETKIKPEEAALRAIHTFFNFVISGIHYLDTSKKDTLRETLSRVFGLLCLPFKLEATVSRSTLGLKLANSNGYCGADDTIDRLKATHTRELDEANKS